jgi:hypothetical protein
MYLVVERLVDDGARGHARRARAELQALQRLVRVLRSIRHRDHQARLCVAAQRLLLQGESGPTRMRQPPLLCVVKGKGSHTRAS